jgi:hypothetical protein
MLSASPPPASMTPSIVFDSTNGQIEAKIGGTAHAAVSKGRARVPCDERAGGGLCCGIPARSPAAARLLRRDGQHASKPCASVSLQTRKPIAERKSAELSTLMTRETPLMTGTDEGPMSHKVVFL